MRSAVHAGALALAGILAVAPAGAEELVLQFADGRRARNLPLEQAQPNSREWFVAANALCAALDLERFWKPETGKLVLKIAERRIQVTVDTRLVIDDQHDVLLRVPVSYRGGSVLLPLEFIERVLVPAAGERFAFDRDALTLHIGRALSDLLAIEWHQDGADTEMVLRLHRSLGFRAESPTPELVRLRFADAKLDPMSLAQEKPAPLVRRLRAEQLQDEAYVYLELDRGIDSFEARAEDDGRTIVVRLQAQLEATPLPGFKLPSEDLASPLTELDERCQVLLLDAGHGGFDAGVRAAGMIEKDVTLELAKRLQPMLDRRLGMRVDLTRSADRVLTTQTRAETANKADGDLLVSLHCNGWVDGAARGFEVLYVGPPGTTESEPVAPATASRAASDFQPWYESQRAFASSSRKFAELLHRELERTLALPSRGVRAAGIDFLKGVSMPAVMIELGFLTNAEDASHIAAPDFAEHLTEAIAVAVERFCEQRRSHASPPPTKFGKRE